MSKPAATSDPTHDISARTCYLARAREYLKIARNVREREKRSNWFVQPESLYWRAMNAVAENRARAACEQSTK